MLGLTEEAVARLLDLRRPLNGGLRASGVFLDVPRLEFAVRQTPERSPTTWNYLIEKESLKFEELEHVLEKVDML